MLICWGWQGVQIGTLPIFTRNSEDLQLCIIGLISRIANACNRNFCQTLLTYHCLGVQTHKFVYIWVGVQKDIFASICLKLHGGEYTKTCAHLVSKAKVCKQV